MATGTATKAWAARPDPDGPNPCPACGKPMEQGFIVAENFVEGARWVRQKTRLGTGGEQIVKPDALGNQYIPGFRCTSCRLMLLLY